MSDDRQLSAPFHNKALEEGRIHVHCEEVRRSNGDSWRNLTIGFRCSVCNQFRARCRQGRDACTVHCGHYNCSN